jgi:hypothetical protein
MAAATRVTLAEYLASDYHPDREYVDGELLERNEGKRRHSRTQARLVNWFMAHKDQNGFEVLTEQRVQNFGDAYSNTRCLPGSERGHRRSHTHAAAALHRDPVAR